MIDTLFRIFRNFVRVAMAGARRFDSAATPSKYWHAIGGFVTVTELERRIRNEPLVQGYFGRRYQIMRYSADELEWIERQTPYTRVRMVNKTTDLASLSPCDQWAYQVNRTTRRKAIK